MRRVSLVATALTAVAIVIGTAGCSGPSGSSSTAASQTLTIANPVALTSFDIPDATGGYFPEYLQPVYDTLLDVSPDGDYLPALATSWTFNDDATALTLDLRDDVTFSDGTKFDADAVKANIEHTKAGTAEAAVGFQTVDSVDVVSPTQVVINFTQPSPSILDSLWRITGMMASPQAISGGSLSTTPVGSGPYVLDASQTTVGSSYTYTANPNYWNPSAVKFSSITIKTIADEPARVNALLGGQVDVAPIDAVDMDQISGTAGYQTIDYTSGDVSSIFFFDRDGTQSPALADVRVRQALNYAVDRAAIVDTISSGTGVATTQIFNPNGAGYSADLDSAYPYDPEKAKALLAEAGYGSGLELSFPDIVPNLTAALQQYFSAVGVTLDVTPVNLSTLVPDVLAGKYGFSWFQLGSFDINQTAAVWLDKNSIWNPFHATDPTIDRLVTTIATSASQDDRDAAAAELGKYTVDQALFVPLYYAKNVYGYSSNVTIQAPSGIAAPPISYFAPAN